MRKMFYAFALCVDCLMVLVFWNSWVVTIPVFFILGYLLERQKIDPRK